ncbi:phage tail tape measure protein [Alkalimonas sp. NCh-2]|uniref:phage tail tape measure protein n=1 Tax=Alkalimonas sp. NCh-2 TaxID=3144846 RepID=UPI0031F607CB
MSTKSLGQLTLDLILKTGSYTEPLDRTTRQTKHQMKEIEKSAQSAGDMVKRSFAALGIGVSLNEIRKYSDAWKDLNGRVRLAVGPMGDANGVMQELEQIARRSYSALETTAEGYLLNATILTELGYRTEEQLKFTNALASGLVASGAKTERAASVTNALSKAIAEGVLRGQNWNTVVQQGGLVVDALADSLGVTRAELDRMARAGELTTDKFVGGLIDQFDELQKKADGMATTVGDAFLQLDNAALKVFGSLAEGTNASGLLAASIMKLADNLETVVKVGLYASTIIGGRLVASMIDSTRSFIENAQAAHANAASQQLAADATTRRALVEKQSAIATLNSARADLANATSAKAVQDATARLTAAKAQALTAIEAYNKSAARSAAINTQLGFASTRAASVLRFFGGGAGLFFTAATAATIYAMSNRDAKLTTEQLTAAINELQGPLESIKNTFKELNDDQRAAKILEWGEAQEEAAKIANREWGKLSQTLFGFQGAFEKLTPERFALIDQLNQARQAGESITPILQKAGEEAGVPQSRINEWIKLAGSFSTAQQEAANAASVVSQLQATLNQGADGSAVRALSEDFEKQAATLVRQIELFGKNTQAAKMLYEIQTGSLAGKLSEQEQNALLALAQKVDYLNESAAAAQKYHAEQEKAIEAVNAFISKARETEQVLKAQLDGTNRIGNAQKELIRFETQFAEIKSKDVLSAYEQEFLAQADSTRAQLEKNAALENEVRQRRAAVALAEQERNLRLSTGSLAEEYDIQLKLFAMGAKQRQIELERLEITRDITRQKEMALQAMQAGDINNDQYKAQIELLDDHLSQRLELFDNYYAQLAEQEGDWTNGMMSALQNYIDHAQDIAGQTEDIFGKLFSGLEDNVLEFVKTGEFSMRELMASIADDVIRMLIRIGVQKLASMALDKTIGTAAAAGYIAQITGQASAQTFMAGLNAFTSTAAIPIVGPALAPGAAAAATSVAGGFAAGAITAASTTLAGMAHSGIDYIPSEGTWLLDKGERVLSARQNEDLSRFLRATDGMQGKRKGAGVGQKVDLNFNFTGLDNDSLLEMLLDNRGTIADMVQMALEDQGVRLD